MYTRIARLACGLGVLIALLAGTAFAQSDIATGTLKGTVRGADGAPLAGATVTASNEGTGFNRSATTDATGFFQIRLLPPGVYTVRAEAEGLTTYEQRGIALQVGDEIPLRIQLEPQTVREEIVVTAEAPIVETTRASLTATVDERALETLPLNGRDFKDLIALTPQAVEVGSERVSIGGARGIMNSFNIDGADSNSSFFGEERGGTRPSFTYSQAAVKEFQVIRSSYNARFGAAAGGIVNAVTKTGTNQFRAEAFYFFQDDGFVEDDAFGRERNEFERQQGGFNLGGPIVQDKVHWFFAYDSQRRDEDVPRGTDDGGFLSIPANRAQWEARLREFGLDPDTEFDYVQTNDNDVLLARIDWSISGNHHLWYRHNFSDQEGANLTSSFFTDGRSTNGLEENFFNSSVVSLNSVLGTGSFNEAIVQFAAERRPRTANFTQIPEMNIGFFDAVIGQNNFLPNFLDEDRLQIQDNYTHFVGNHTIKAGVDYNQIEFDDGFCRFCGGQYLFFSFRDFFNNRPFEYTQAFSPVNGIVKYDTDLLYLYVSDEWRVRDNVTVELGLRWEHQDNPTPEMSNPLEPRTGQIPDDSNLAPRVGFAWDIRGDGRSVLRGGAGVFYSPTPSLLVANALLTNGVTVTRLTLRPGDPAFPAFPNRLPPDFGGANTFPPDIFVFGSAFENPETRRASIGYEQVLGQDFTVGAEVVYADSKNFERKRDSNLDPTPVGFTADGRPIYGAGSRFGARLNPAFRKIMEFVSDAEAEYFSIALTARKRFRDNWTFQGSYTYAESKDHDTNERSVSSTSSGFPEDHFNLDQDWGWSDYDVRNRVVLSGTYVAPHDITISAIAKYRDAFPINPFVDIDLNGDGFTRDRPGPDPDLGLTRHLDRNSFRGSSFLSLDLRIAKAFRFAGRHEIEIIGEVFNVTDEDNFIAFDDEFASFDRGTGTLVKNDRFGEPIAAGRPREYQIGLRWRM